MFSGTKSACLAVILILLAGNVYFGDRYFSLQEELSQSKSSLAEIQSKKKYLDFNKMFVEKILNVEGTVDLESRRELEIAARNLGDAEVLSQWKEFTDSPSEKSAQTAIKNLLKTLA
jgi:hypothetical protein